MSDITKAYENKKLLSATRKVTFTDTSVSITDSFSLSGKAAVTERFISLRKAEAADGKLVFGETSLIYPENKVTLKITEEKHTPHEYDTEDITVYLYDFILKENANEVRFEIRTNSI